MHMLFSGRHEMKAGPLIVFGATLMALISCYGVRAEYSEKPVDPGLYVEKYNHVMEIGSCGMPWNYSNIYYIDNHGKFGHLTSDQIVLTRVSFTIKVLSGYVDIDNDKHECDVELKVDMKGPDEPEYVGDLEVNGKRSYTVEK
jgi:hypothetical protein